MKTFNEFCLDDGFDAESTELSCTMLFKLTYAEKQYLKYLSIFYGSQGQAIRQLITGKVDEEYLAWVKKRGTRY